MYTLKSSELKRLTVAEIQAANLPEGRIFQLLLSFVLTKGEGQDLGVSTFIDNEADAVNAINQNLARLNAQEELIAKVADGSFTIVVEEKEKEVVQPTAEELERAAIEAKRVILREAKADFEIALLTQAEFDAKVAAVKAPEVKEK